MKDTLTKHYDTLTAPERFRLALIAQAGEWEDERQRLVKTCPKKDYRMNDEAFTDRIEATSNITACFCIDLAERYGRLVIINAVTATMPGLVNSIVIAGWQAIDRNYENGFREGWKAAGGKGKLPKIKLPDEPEPDWEEPILTRALTRIGKDLQTQVKTQWEAYSEFCRQDLGLEPEIPLEAFFPSVLEWLEEAEAGDAPVDEDMKSDLLEIMRDYWQKCVTGS